MPKHSSKHEARNTAEEEDAPLKANVECFIQKIGPDQKNLNPSRSAPMRNRACSPNLPLPTTVDGARTCWETFSFTANRFPERKALGHRPILRDGNAGDYVFESYRDVADHVNQLSKAMIKYQASKGSRIGIYGVNCPEYIKAMVATSSISAICVPLYDALGGPGAVSYVISHSGMKLAFVQDKKLSDMADAIEDAHKSYRQARREGRSDVDPVRLKTVIVWGRKYSPSSPAPAAALEKLHQHGVRDVMSFRGFMAIHAFYPTKEFPPGLQTATSLVKVLGGQLSFAEAKSGAGNALTSVASHRVDESLFKDDEEEDAEASKPEDARKAAGQAAAPPISTMSEFGLSRPEPEDLCTIMYTSGTTGKPKGVMITHRALISVVSSQLTFLADPCGDARKAYQSQLDELPEDLRAAVTAKDPLVPAKHVRQYVQTKPDDAHLSYLPLAHIYERALVEAAIALGQPIGFWQGDVNKLQADAACLKPALMVGVPRVWERVRESVVGKIDSRTAIAKKLFRHFFEQKKRNMSNGKPAGDASRMGDGIIFKKVQAALGGNLKMVISGAAPLSRDLEEFIRVALCCYASQGYGLTETCSASAVAIPDHWDMVGTVGPVQTCVDFMLESVPELGYDALGSPARGELLLSGPCVFNGYFRNDSVTKEVKEHDGWFHTGDIVELLPSGALKIIDRKKNIIKMAQGEYVAVELVETSLAGSAAEYIHSGNCWVHGDPTQRRLVAVVVPRKATLMHWADKAAHDGVVPRDLSYEQLCAHPAAKSHVLEGLDKAGKRIGLTTIQRPAAVFLDTKEWTVDSGLITPTHKLKRHELIRFFQPQIKDMYSMINARGG